MRAIPTITITDEQAAAYNAGQPIVKPQPPQYKYRAFGVPRTGNGRCIDGHANDIMASSHKEAAQKYLNRGHVGLSKVAVARDSDVAPHVQNSYVASYATLPIALKFYDVDELR